MAAVTQFGGNVKQSGANLDPWGRSSPLAEIPSAVLLRCNRVMATASKLASCSCVIDSAPATSSSPSTEAGIVPRRRFQRGRVYQRGKRWVGSFREYEVNPETGKRARRTITFDESVTSMRAALDALKPYLDEYNARAKANLKPSVPRGGKTVRALLDEWTDKILPNRKPGGARAALSHIRAYILPQIGEVQLREMNLS